METIKNLYRVGRGPSASHTIGPARAAQSFMAQNEGAASYRVSLYGSLAATGKGHRTDAALEKTFGKRRLEIEWHPEIVHPRHTNAMRFEALDNSGNVIADWMAYSIGGGAVTDDSGLRETGDVYPHDIMDDILGYCYG